MEEIASTGVGQLDQCANALIYLLKEYGTELLSKLAVPSNLQLYQQTLLYIIIFYIACFLKILSVLVNRCNSSFALILLLHYLVTYMYDSGASALAVERDTG